MASKVIEVNTYQTDMLTLRDKIAALLMVGWNYSITAGTGTNKQPQYHYYKNGALWIRKTLTWGTSGDDDGNITQVVFEYSSNSGGAYDTIGTIDYTYTGHALTAADWI